MDSLLRRDVEKLASSSTRRKLVILREVSKHMRSAVDDGVIDETPIISSSLFQ